MDSDKIEQGDPFPTPPSLAEQLATLEPVTAAELDALAIEDLSDEEWVRFAEALGL